MTDVIEGKARDVTDELAEEGPSPAESRAVALAAPTQAIAPTQGFLAVGAGAIAAMTDEQFETNLSKLAKSVERIERVKKAIMDEGVDFGIIPGTKSPTLLKAGAEKLALAYGLVVRFTHRIRYGDQVTSPAITVVVDSFAHLGSTEGPVIAQGMGACNTWETRYRYRGAKARTCPKCGAENVIRSNRDDGWWCGTRDGGCGASFAKDDPDIVSQGDPGKAENADPNDLLNTILKMGEKRAMVDVVLRATASSGMFTQDMDENEGDGYGGSGRAGQSAPTSRGAGQGAPQSRGAVSAPTASRSEAPGPSTAGTVQIVVSEQPESGVRMVRDGHTEKRWEGERPKLEIVGKVGNRKHTAIVLGPLAEAAVEANIQVGEVVQFVGAVVEEIEWAPDKPKKKEVWGTPEAGYLMTDVQVGRDNAWVSLAATMPSLGLDESTASSPASTSETPASPSSPDTASSPAATSPGPASTSDASSTPPLRTGKPEEGDVAIRGTLYAPIERHLKGQTLVAVIRVLTPEGELVRAGMTEDIDEQLGPDTEPWFAVGDPIQVVGTWKPTGWLVAEFAGKPQ